MTEALATNDFLEEMRLLFGSPRVEAANGRFDAGFNCQAVSFVTAYLCRLRSMEVDVCEGPYCLSKKGGSIIM